MHEIAIMTGYRADGIRSLKPECFSLDNEYPSITNMPTISKRRKRDVQPLPDALVEPLRAWL